MALTSAAGIVSLLEDKDHEVIQYALATLNDMIDSFWAEIADSVPTIEMLYENKNSSFHQLAGLLAAKIYFHLGELEESISFALGAGDLLNLNCKSEFVETIIARCIDCYIAQRSLNAVPNPNEKLNFTPEMFNRLEKVVNHMFQRCIQDKEYKQAIGIALESRRLDVIEAAVNSGDKLSLLKYVLDSSIKFVPDVKFREEVLRLLVKIYSELDEPDYFSMAICFVILKDSAKVSEIINDLSKKSENHQLIAMQLAFDLEEVADQDFLKSVSDGLVECALSTKLRKILGGQVTIQLHLEFLHRNNKADLLILKATKQSIESRNSLHHVSITFANALMNAGTTNDQFLRDNLDWLSRANNWSKFSATAALGVIHKGHLDQSMKLLQPYLPQNGVTSSAFSEGGALFALGLMNANHAAPLDYLCDALKKTSGEVIQHGACLGIGASGMATGNAAIYEDLKSILYLDNAIASDAAALGMGLLMVGRGDKEVLDEMLQYARETQHERIIRSLSIAMALVMYGREDAASGYIEVLLSDKDALIRYGGVYMIALAYAGTGSNKALRQVLHLAVSDVNDDVRRAAVTAIGFVYLNNPALVPRVVELLSESFNPHVRYGAAMALGISGASYNLPEALALLEPLQSDTSDFVRQGSFIAQCFVQAQQNNLPTLRANLSKIILDRHESILTKFGAVIGQGILDAGGRNCCFSLRSRYGTLNMSSVVGMTLFLQYWHWFPLTHFLSLSLQPTALIALDKDLRLPRINYYSLAKPGSFDYPAAIIPPSQEKIEKMHAVLSTSAKAQSRARRRGSQANSRRHTISTSSLNMAAVPSERMDIDSAKPPVSPVKHSAPNSSNPDGMKVVAPSDDTITDDILPSIRPIDVNMARETDNSHSTYTMQEPRLPPATMMEVDPVQGNVAANILPPQSLKPKGSSASYEVKCNFSRVLPAQEKYISFEGCPYQPVRSTRLSGILVTSCSVANYQGSFIDVAVNLCSESATAAEAATVLPTGEADLGYSVPDVFDYGSNDNDTKKG